MTYRRDDTLAPLVADCGTANELARLMGVHPITLSKWRSGKRVMPEQAKQHANLLAFARSVALPFPETLPKDPMPDDKPKRVTKAAVHALAPNTFRTLVISEGRCTIIMQASGAKRWREDVAWRNTLRESLEDMFEQVTIFAPPSRTTGQTGATLADWIF